jgi:hypothetical protein
MDLASCGPILERSFCGRLKGVVLKVNIIIFFYLKNNLPEIEVRRGMHP